MRSTTPTEASRPSASTTATATVSDTARVAAGVLAPALAGGVIKRRPAAMALVSKLRLDRPGIDLLRRLRARYGSGPLRLRVPGRAVTLLLSADDVGTVLARTPEPFSPATTEKKAALRHFQPHGVLISTGEQRARRREFHESILEPERPLHELAEPLAAAIRDETAALLARAGAELDWNTFNEHWWKAVRRIVLGEPARDAHEVTDRLDALRHAGNWAYLHPRLRSQRDQLTGELREWVRRAEPNSLAAMVANTRAEPGTDPVGQLPHWLFAFDAAGMAVFRTLALLASHPDHYRRAKQEASEDLAPRQLPYLRGCVLESLRLWPTTPLLLRESTTDSSWGPAGTTFVIFAPLFHRDPEALPYADAFSPEVWTGDEARRHAELVPFSGGTGVCPGRNLVLFTTTTMLATLLAECDYQPHGAAAFDPARALPATTDNFRMSFTLRPSPCAES